MLKKLVPVFTGICLILSACGKNNSSAMPIKISETAVEYETLSYGEFKERTGNEAEFYHADRFIGEIPNSTLCTIYVGEYDESIEMAALSDDDMPIRIQGALGALLDGIDEEMSVTELTDALSKNGAAQAVYELSEGAGTAYYVGDRYADIQFDSNLDGKNESRLLISLDNAADEKVNTESIAWLERNTDIDISQFWDEEAPYVENTLKFITGLEIILPDSWDGKTIFESSAGAASAPSSATFTVCEKTNAEADGSGVLFYLSFYLHEDGEEQYIFETDKVLGLYEQGDKQYVLVLEMPREMMYVEGNAELQANYEAVSADIDLLQIKTDGMSGFTECGADDLEWVEYM